MNALIDDFVAVHLPFPGLAAYGSRAADSTLNSQCYAHWLSPSQVEEAVTRLIAAAESLPERNLNPVTLCWVFEQLRIHLAVRADGAALALFVENRPEMDHHGAELVLAEFTRI